MECVHPTHVWKYENLTKNARKRKAVSDSSHNFKENFTSPEYPVHWVDQTDFQRQSTCLALRKMKTDNGANFVKALSVFGQQSNDESDDDNGDDSEANVDVVFDVNEAVLILLNTIFYVICVVLVTQ